MNSPPGATSVHLWGEEEVRRPAVAESLERHPPLPRQERDESMNPRLPAERGGHVWSSLSGRSCVNIKLSFLLRFTHSKLFSVFANTFYSECKLLLQHFQALRKGLGDCFPPSYQVFDPWWRSQCFCFSRHLSRKNTFLKKWKGMRRMYCKCGLLQGRLRNFCKCPSYSFRCYLTI